MRVGCVDGDIAPSLVVRTTDGMMAKTRRTFAGSPSRGRNPTCTEQGFHETDKPQQQSQGQVQEVLSGPSPGSPRHYSTKSF